VAEREPYADEIAGIIRAEAARAGMRTRDVANVLQQAGSTVSNKMTGKNNFSISDIVRFARHLGLTPGELIDNVDVPTEVRRQRLARLAEAETAEPEGAQTEADDDQDDDDDTGSGGLRRQGPDSGDSGGGAQAPSGDVEAPEGAVRDTAREFVFGGPDRRRSGDLSIFSSRSLELDIERLNDEDAA